MVSDRSAKIFREFGAPNPQRPGRQPLWRQAQRPRLASGAAKPCDCPSPQFGDPFRFNPRTRAIARSAEAIAPQRWEDGRAPTSACRSQAASPRRRVRLRRSSNGRAGPGGSPSPEQIVWRRIGSGRPAGSCSIRNAIRRDPVDGPAHLDRARSDLGDIVKEPTSSSGMRRVLAQSSCTIRRGPFAERFMPRLSIDPTARRIAGALPEALDSARGRPNGADRRTPMTRFLGRLAKELARAIDPGRTAHGQR